ncbi:MAG: hypothetical protein MZW92_49890 [Comamonadaceae bacterium]|nr:hypothetical protein [Comamonadaceae bacterium]
MYLKLNTGMNRLGLCRRQRSRRRWRRCRRFRRWARSR